MTKDKLLRCCLVLSGLAQIGYFGIVHLFFPSAYLRSVGIVFEGENLAKASIFLHEIGVLAIGFGVATILAARNPVRNVAIIAVLYAVGLGSVLTSAYHILFAGMTPGEWLTVAVLGVQMLVIGLLYPWSELLGERVSERPLAFERGAAQASGLG